MKKQHPNTFHPRQFMRSREFEVFYYSDLHFSSVDRHTHDFFELYFFVEGAVEMEIGHRRFPLSPGDLILIPPGLAHRAMVRDPSQTYRRFVLWLSRSYCDCLQSKSPDYTYLLQQTTKERRYIYSFDQIEFNVVRSKLFSLLDEISSDRFGREERMSLSVCDLILHLNRSVYETQHRRSVQENVTTYEAITSFIDSHLDETLSLDRIAREFFISKYYVAHLFQERTGLSVHQYIMKKRLSACCDAIQAGSSIGEACSLCGFRDYSSFYRAFRHEYGVSPSEYRTHHLEDGTSHLPHKPVDSSKSE